MFPFDDVIIAFAGIVIECTMLLSALSLVANVIIVNLYQKTPRYRMSRRVHIAVFKFLSKIVCYGTSSSTHTVGMRESISKKPMYDSDLKSSQESNCHASESAEEADIKNAHSTMYGVAPTSGEQLITEEWHAAADVLDRTFLYVFTFIFVTFGIYEMFQGFK